MHKPIYGWTPCKICLKYRLKRRTCSFYKFFPFAILNFFFLCFMLNARTHTHTLFGGDEVKKSPGMAAGTWKRHRVLLCHNIFIFMGIFCWFLPCRPLHSFRSVFFVCVCNKSKRVRTQYENEKHRVEKKRLSHNIKCNKKLLVFGRCVCVCVCDNNHVKQ